MTDSIWDESDSVEAAGVVVATRLSECLARDQEAPDALRHEIEGWLEESAGLRPFIAGKDNRYVDATDIASHLIRNCERKAWIVVRWPDKKLLRIARAAFWGVLEHDVGLDLPSAVPIELRGAEGQSVWIVDVWGGGYVAWTPRHEFLGPFKKEAEAEQARGELGFMAPDEITVERLPAIRAAVAEEGRSTPD